MESPDDNLDHLALGYYAPRKGLARNASPYAEGTDAHAQWLAGYDAALRGEPEPARAQRERGALSAQHHRFASRRHCR